MTLNFTDKAFTIGGEGTEPTLQFYKRGFSLGSGTVTPDWRDIVISGNTALTLVNAKEDGLNYVKLFGKTVQNTDTYIESVTLSGATSQTNLPEGHTQLEYIQNGRSGNYTCKIDTGIMPEVGDVLEIMFTPGSAGISNYLIQSRNTSSGTIFGISGSQSDDSIMATWGGVSVKAQDIVRKANHKYYIKASFLTTGTTLYIKDLTDKTEETRTGTLGETEPVATYYLFGNKGGQTLQSVYSTYMARITNGNRVKLFYLPDKYNDTTGFYNEVTGTIVTATSGTLYGSADNATPHPYAPINLVSNNGIIKHSANIFNKNSSGNTYGSYINDSGVVTSDGYSTISDFIVCEPNVTYTAQCIALKTASNLRIHCYDETKTWIGMIAKEPCTVGELTTATGTTLGNAKYIKVSGYLTNYNSAGEDVGMVEIGSTASSYVAYGLTAVDGTTETITDNLGNTATAQLLLKASTSYDTQEVLTGAVTRNVAIKILDGSENWSVVTTGTYPFFRVTNIVANSGNLVGESLLCTHFPSGSVGSANQTQGIRIYSNAIFLRYDSLFASDDNNLTAFKTWLAEQYNAGTPVTLVYILENATTETVASQTLVETPITQTAGSISNMPITTVTSNLPSPTHVKNITCNNGVLKVSGNLLNRNDLEGGYLLTDEGQRGSSNNNWILTNFIKVKPNTSYIFDFVSGGDSVYRRVCGYSTNDYNSFTELLVKKQRPVTEGERFSEPFTTSATTNYIKVSTYKADTNIQITEGTGAIPYRAYGQIYTDGTVETVTDELNNTATAEILLSLGSYNDTQEVLTGSIIRNNGIKVFDGTENWTVESGTYPFFKLSNAVNSIISNATHKCTHFPSVQVISTNNNQGIRINRLEIAIRYDNLYTASSENLPLFKQWLADQYNAGTPVILVYPLETSATSTVTGQTLTTIAGTNTIEITQASINNLPLEVSYKAGVSVTITQIQNANLDNSVTVTIGE